MMGRTFGVRVVSLRDTPLAIMIGSNAQGTKVDPQTGKERFFTPRAGGEDKAISKPPPEYAFVHTFIICANRSMLDHPSTMYERYS